MPGEQQLEITKPKQVQEFKTEQVQEQIQEQVQDTMQLQHTMFAGNAPAPVTPQRDQEIRAKRRRGILGKNKNEEEIYGTTESDMKDTYARERKDAFQQHLSELSAEHMKMKTIDLEFQAVIRKIREYVKIPTDRRNLKRRGETLTQAREMIQNYIASQDGVGTLDGSDSKELQIMKMYALYFSTFMDGNLEVPQGAQVKEVTGENEPELRKRHQSGWLAGTYKDASKEVLFPSEPSIEDVEQGELGDCYLLAGLVSVVMSDPMAIKKAMRDNGDGTVTVRFFEPVLDSNNEQTGLKPVYVTVNKTVPKYKLFKQNMYNEGGLWVSMIEKAYAAWGKHTNSKTEAIDNQIKEQIKSKCLAQGMDMEKAEQTATEEFKNLTKNGSYEKISSGSAEKFIEILTGKEKEKRMYSKMIEKSAVGEVINYHVIRAASQEMSYLFTMNKGNVGIEKIKGAFDRFSGEFGEVKANQLLEMSENHMPEMMSILTTLNTTLQKFSQVVIKKFYEKDNDSKQNSIGDEPAIKQVKPIYLEDIQELMRAEINKHLYTAENKMKVNIAKKYKPVLNDMVERILHRIEELQNEHAETEDSEVGVDVQRAQFVHRGDVGTYTKYAEREYKYIQDSLKNGYHVGVGTYKFAKGKGSGLNGESESEGLVEGHAYTVLGTKEMGGKKFIKLRNPWARGTLQYVRTKGPDGKEKIRRELKKDYTDDGIFFMELNEFIARVSELKVNKEVSQNILPG